MLTRMDYVVTEKSGRSHRVRGWWPRLFVRVPPGTGNHGRRREYLQVCGRFFATKKYGGWRRARKLAEEEERRLREAHPGAAG